MIDQKIETAFEAYENGETAQAYKIFEEMKNEVTPGSEEASAYQHALGYLYIVDQKFDKAREHYQSMLEEAADEERPSILHQLGTIEQMDSEFSQAEEYFKQEAALLTSDDHEGQATNHYAHGYTVMLKGDYQSAQELLKQARAKAQDALSIAHTERALGELHAAQNDMQQACEHFKNAKSQFRIAGDEMGASEIEMLESIIFE
ncbi:hypothetical protein ERX37_05600 [Macrococcus hajekii]|uniref:Uncharacterized protein n=1 Tax=Macrococcus hajekii TaxID=198482 RepID=A0A4R6BJ23_9STAP|nr:hypothetical protein [Macrococcus hajekii]TDM01685.1 hypothetical protein ERX37_05600 [Macrococcus hajekii]GGB06584.1 hypothetical protein GCM10007190_13280 [Macrococcus hajekii]